MKLTLFTISNEQIKEQLSKLQTKVESLETVKIDIALFVLYSKMSLSRSGFNYLLSPDGYFNWLEIAPRSLLFRYIAPQEEPTPYSYN
ncbi:hypothetical protein WBS58_25215 [Bacillus albus]|uniref:hypothetical protein n=1 Tax=Bacillus albus TaxID=2026189 RepID=UPI0030141D8C